MEPGIEREKQIRRSKKLIVIGLPIVLINIEI